MGRGGLSDAEWELIGSDERKQLLHRLCLMLSPIWSRG